MMLAERTRRIHRATDRNSDLRPDKGGAYPWLMSKGRIWRISRFLGDGTAGTLRIKIQNRSYAKATDRYKAIEKFPDDKKKDESSCWEVHTIVE